MKSIILITKNERKVASLKSIVYRYGYDVDVTDISPPEIQANSTAEIAAFAAKWAADKINKPCVKMDSGFFIDEFGSFPGAYVRWVDEGLGAARFFEIVKNTENKRAMITCSVAYCEPKSEPITFFGSTLGRVPNTLGTIGSFIDRLFIPDEYNPKNLTLGELRDIDPNSVVKIWGKAEKEFVRWLSKRQKQR